MGFVDETILFEASAISLNLSFGIEFWIFGKLFFNLFLIPLVTLVFVFAPLCPDARRTSLPISVNA